MEDRLKIEMSEEVKKIQKSRVLTIHGTRDQTIPFKDAEAFDACVAQHELSPIDGGDHNFTAHEAKEAVASKSVEFILKSLQ